MGAMKGLAHPPLNPLEGFSQGLDLGSLLYTLILSLDTLIRSYSLNYHLCARKLNFLPLTLTFF